jgi:hypothetical protein
MVRELLDLAFLFYAVSLFCTALYILFVDPLCLVLSLSLLSHFPMSFNFYSLGSLPSSFYVWRTLKFVLVSVLVFTNIFFLPNTSLTGRTFMVVLSILPRTDPAISNASFPAVAFLYNCYNWCCVGNSATALPLQIAILGCQPN